MKSLTIRKLPKEVGVYVSVITPTHLVVGCMEDDDKSNSSNQFNDDGDENRIVQLLLHTNISSKRKQYNCFGMIFETFLIRCL